MSEPKSPGVDRPADTRPVLPSVQVDLSRFTTGKFDRGAGVIKEGLWLVASLILFRMCPFSFSALKCMVLRAFGAVVGRNVTIKPMVSITFPWKLTMGSHVWLGERCWLQNLAPIILGNNICISQRAYLCTGSHDYKLPTFDLITQPITVEDGAWLAADSWVGPGVTIGTHAVLAAGSVTSRSLEPYGIYRGNPASLVKQRIMSAATGI